MNARFKLGVFIVAVAIIALAGKLSYFTVNPYERVVVTRFGDILYVAAPGFHFKIPFVDATHAIRTDIRNLQPGKQGENTYTIDNQEIDVIFNVFYRVPIKNVEYIYTNVPDFRHRLYIMAVDRLKSEMGKVNANHVATKRGEIRDAIKAVLAHDARSLGVEVTEFQLTNLEYTRSYRQAVEMAASQKAGIEAREYERQQAQKTAQRAAIEAEGKANAIRAEAKGQADANLLVAEAEAKAIRLKGEAQAAAIKAQADALRQNAALVELRKAERWDGKLPTQMLSGITPLMTFQAPQVPAP
jgi:regulator of protease activity HflC (stomatin/prohibitin superfamily)